MNITFFIGSTTGGGAEHVICELATYMSEHGHRTTILTVTQTLHSYSIGKDVEVATLDLKGVVKLPKFRTIAKMCKLFRYVRCSKTDLYVVFLPDTIRALMFFRRWIHKPVLISERNAPTSYSDKLQEQMINAFRQADGCVFQTEDAFSFYAKAIPNLRQATVIPNAITGKVTEPYTGRREKKIVSVGRFNEQKNFPLLIKSFAKIRKANPEYKLYIYGMGNLLGEYTELCKNLGIEEAVCFPGFVSDVTDRIKDASAFVLSSDYEGMPNALIEAMSLGLPCVSTDCDGGGARFLIQSGENGYLVEKGNVDALSDGILKILNNPKDAERIGRNAQKIAEKLSKENVYSAWKKQIESVAEQYEKKRRQL